MLQKLYVAHILLQLRETDLSLSATGWRRRRQVRDASSRKNSRRLELVSSLDAADQWLYTCNVIQAKKYRPTVCIAKGFY